MMNKQRKNIAIIGASYFQLPLIEKAKKMGYITHVFAWAANDVGESVADFFYPISIVEKEQILDKCKEIGICGICSIASDLAAITVNYVAESLGLTGNTMEAAKISTNKNMMRTAFKQNGDPSPKSVMVDEKTDLSTVSLAYPIIIKPTDRSGSRGIFKLEQPDFASLKKAVFESITDSFEKKALIEEFAEGKEYSVEYISFKGEHHFLAMTEKYTTGAPHFIETGHLEPAPVSNDVLEKVKAVVVHALNTLGIKNSASHSELKIADDGSIRIIEIGGRMGGDCIGSDLVRYSTGVDFVRAVIQVACGEMPDLSPVCTPQPVKINFIFNYKDLYEYNRIKKEEPERLLKEVYLDEKLLDKATNSSDRAGCYIVKA
ncbi:ATP-grasp domain-containing protein [Clostridium ljungdahlii]|uniref:Alanine-anticapsin ligase BacD n=1 Tax=Clostridium ljungdahlii TaxID=1538 RepID=A0A168NV41_9CLOT|nr:ATP-grasp domain-containing protein [Clostridium ljungdahlii]OAA86949.1 Alanine-anticapsin ligase BacD [Clostridium ljungdahlii]